MQPWFTCITSFDIGHPCDGQLTPVKTRYPLTISHDHIAGLRLELIKIEWFFEVDRRPSAGFRMDQGLMSG